MRIYVGTYGKYNNGSIAGDWLDLEDYSDITEFTEAALALHSNESDPELMFQDYEDDGFTGLISEHGVNPAAWDILELDEHDQLKVKAMLWNHPGDFEHVMANYDDCIVTPCDYAHEAESVYFDQWCENNADLVKPFEDANIVGYLDEKQIWYDAQQCGVHFIDGIGIVEFTA